ncbi:MAG: cyclic nucleotide-binding domain-containing protein [Anaerolineae bacterium]|nr:cyclic nucleotide-binding domain-containing protein [Anaerolineae bacterium]
MQPENEKRINLLKQVLIFNEFSDEELAEVVERLKDQQVNAGAIIFHEGDAPDAMYIIYGGKMEITHQGEDGTDVFLASVDDGDTFGADGLLKQKPRSATIKALEDTDLLYLDTDDFNWLITVYPSVKAYLDAFTNTYKFRDQLKISWLGNGEVLNLVQRRHVIRLIGEFFFIWFFISIALLVVIIIGVLFNQASIVLISVGVIGGVILLAGLAGSLWAFMEWKNDYFFVTNVRVVWRERILLRSSSRQEVPLRTIQSLGVQTGNVLARAIQVGDVVIKTFNSEMRLTDVHNPERMRNMISAFLSKTKTISKRAEINAIRQTVRRRLGYEPEIIEPELPEDVPVATDRARAGFWLFRARTVDGDTITYNKHWSVFLVRAWAPTTLLFFSSIITIWMIRFMISNPILLILGVMPLSIFFWWLYEYVDWKNDIYCLTRDRIIDREKSPLGQESFRSAPIKNIQSVGHAIPNTIGLILNVGHVEINVGDQTLTFEGVYNPALVHQDISQRMEEGIAKAEKGRIAAEHERMATWLEIYHNQVDGSQSADHEPDLF